MKAAWVAILSLSLGACATVLNGDNQTIKIETKNAQNELVRGLDCSVSNDKSSARVRSGESVSVHRSSKDLDIMCSDEEHGEANGRVISRVNGGMFGNIILGGGIGAVVDHAKGTAYSYPTWLQLVLGESRVYDKRAEQAGQPLLGNKVDDVKEAE